MVPHWIPLFQIAGLNKDVIQMLQQRNAVFIFEISRVRARKIKHLNQKKYISLMVKEFADIVPCTSVIIVLNQEILLIKVRKITMMTWDDYNITYYDDMNYYFYEKKVKNMSLFNIHSIFATIPLFFFNQFWKNIGIIKVFFGLNQHFSEGNWKKK